MAARNATHAGSWYSANPSTLAGELDGWLAQASHSDLPKAGARVIIAPHAGYSYSGPTAAWAYQALDLSAAKRVFLLGPSHHVYLTGAALTRFDLYATPLGDLRIDRDTTSELFETGHFEWMSASTDKDEHSLELHLPYIHRMLSRAQRPGGLPPLVPIMVGATDAAAERRLGAVLAPYLEDPTNVFVVSSDFAHWGLRFRYTYYLPKADTPLDAGVPHQTQPAADMPIFESIARIDRACMAAAEQGRLDDFRATIKSTGNTVCGQHPIGVMLAAFEALDRDEGPKFKFVKYDRSSDCKNFRDSSVSYVSGYAIV